MQEVEDWLLLHSNAGGTSLALPPDLQPESLEFLRRLAAESTHRDNIEQELSRDAENRAAQHAAELADIENILQQCGLAPQSLPTAIVSSLGML